MKEKDGMVNDSAHFRFMIRDGFWLTLLIVLAGAWLWDHRYTTQQLNFCIEALHQVEQELDEQYADADRQISSLRHGLTGAQAAAAEARSNAAVNAELEYQIERAQLWRGPHRQRH
jgi:septal ring factor EnvC (AmiA/AmiB activator)